jgi:hypothetical protein
MRRVHLGRYGTLLPHVFMTDVLLHVGGCVGTIVPLDGGGEVSGILGVLEQGFALGDRETRNVIAISFVRDARLEPFYWQLRPLLGPRLRAQI